MVQLCFKIPKKFPLFFYQWLYTLRKEWYPCSYQDSKKEQHTFERFPPSVFWGKLHKLFSNRDAKTLDEGRNIGFTRETLAVTTKWNCFNFSSPQIAKIAPMTTHFFPNTITNQKFWCLCDAWNLWRKKQKAFYPTCFGNDMFNLKQISREFYVRKMKLFLFSGLVL